MGLTLVLTSPADAVDGVTPAMPILGLPLLRRTALAARRSGFDEVVVEFADPDGSVAGALAGTGARFASGIGSVGAIRLEWNRVVSKRDLESLRAGEPSTPSGAGVVLRSASDLGRAERHLLRSLVKDEEGFMSRHVERKISLAVSRRLAATSVTPNAMTIVSVAIGLAGAAFFLSPLAGMQLAGALLFLLHSILDGCDGELARLKFQESRFGGVLDFWGDNVVHSAVFGCIAFGWSRAAGAAWPLLLGASAVAGTLLSAGFVYATTMRAPKDGPQFTSVSAGAKNRVTEIADTLARRDFIYLVVLLSAFGKAGWFLALSAVGAPVFFVVLVVNSIGRKAP